MSAVRMVAYGVLELKGNSHPPKPQHFLSDADAQMEQDRKDMFERDQLRKLVNDELKSYGLMLLRNVVPKAGSWRTKSNEHVLYGQLQRAGFQGREVLHVGDFKECCEVAARLLDKLDASQVPDTES